MPPKNNIELGCGQLYFKTPEGFSKPIDISHAEIETETEWADDQEYIKINNASEASFECELQGSQEWVAVYCQECYQPIPVTMFYYLMHGATGWLCPCCAMRKRMRENK